MKSMIITIACFLIMNFNLWSQYNLTDKWELHISSIPVWDAIFMDVIHKGDSIFISGIDWAGKGKMTTDKIGYYYWETPSGKKGSASIEYIPEFDQVVLYIKSGVYKLFYGHRKSRAIENFTGIWSTPSANGQILVADQTGNDIRVFWDFVEPNQMYADGYVSGNFIYANYSRPIASGDEKGFIYVYKSIDGKKIRIIRFVSEPTPAMPGGADLLLETRSSFASPATGWIGITGNQTCYQGGVLSGSLSCNSPDDFEESHYCMDPRVLQLIDYWLANARPFANWEGATYDCWGRWIGTNPDGKALTVGNCHRPDTDGMTRCEYLMAHLWNENPGSNVAGLTNFKFFVRSQIIGE